tara:strand:- start:2225 stop:2422 length:198 start_codon:yes stop_codon:yes gene_type:complete
MIIDDEAMRARVRKYVANLIDEISDEAWEIAIEHTSHNESNDEWYNTDREEVLNLVHEEIKHFIQ